MLDSIALSQRLACEKSRGIAIVFSYLKPRLGNFFFSIQSQNSEIRSFVDKTKYASRFAILINHLYDRVPYESLALKYGVICG